MIVHDIHVTRISRNLPTTADQATSSTPGRAGVLVTVWNREGQSGVGEAAPLEGFTEETTEQAFVQLQSIAKAWSQNPPGSMTSAQDVDVLVCQNTWYPTVRFAIEQALLTLLAAETQTSLAELLGGRSTLNMPSHQLVRNVEESVEAVRAGYTVLKIKVGQPWQDHVAKIAAIREAVGPDIAMRLDANGSWPPKPAEEALAALEPLGIACIEEPLAGHDLRALAALKQKTSIPIGLDESVRTLEALNRSIALQSGDTLVLKPMFIGGLKRSVEMANRAKEAGMNVFVTSTLESPVGLEGAQAVAQAIAPWVDVCGLSRAHLSDSPVPSRPHEVQHPLMASAADRPCHVALTLAGTAGPTHWTYRELKTRVAEAAYVLKQRGITPGSRVGIAGPRDHQWVIWMHAVSWAGATAVLIPHTATELEFNRYIEMGALDLLTTDRPRSDVACQSWACPKADGLLPPRPWKLDAPQIELFTSGSTGTPKSVSLTGNQLLFSTFGSAIRCGHSRDDVWGCALPLEHVGGLSILLRTAWLGTTAYVWPRFVPEAINAAIDAGEITQCSLVPTMLDALLDDRGDRPAPKTLRMILIGGAAASESLIARASALSLPLLVTWGMSETASQVATTWVKDSSPRGVGAALPFANVRVLATGQLRIEGPIAGPQGVTTQDTGHIGADHHIHITGRNDRTIISGGSNIAPAEVEAVLETHPSIDEACVVGLPDPTWGERPHALMVHTDGAERPTDIELETFLGAQLRRYKIPDRFTWTDRIPRNSMGKIVLTQVRALLDSCPPQ